MTITIYRTHYTTLYGEQYVQCFSFPPPLVAQMDQWERTQDRLVFDEQMATGSFRGRFPVDESYRFIMRKMEQDGHIQPYYGFINATACTYTFVFHPPFISITLHHTVVDTIAHFEDDFIVTTADATTIAAHHHNGFMIRQQEYHNLCAWKHWSQADEFTLRYRYSFAPTTVLLLIEITDVNTGEVIDITEYDH